LPANMLRLKTQGRLSESGVQWSHSAAQSRKFQRVTAVEQCTFALAALYNALNNCRSIVPEMGTPKNDPVSKSHDNFVKLAAIHPVDTAFRILSIHPIYSGLRNLVIMEIIRQPNRVNYWQNSQMKAFMGNGNRALKMPVSEPPDFRGCREACSWIYFPFL